MATAFNVGDMAVYPVQGVTEILGIETLEIAGVRSSFYVLRCLDSDDTIKVPTKNAAHVGLRSVVDAEEIGAVLEQLRATTIVVEEPNWNRRQRRYSEKLQSGDLRQVAQVLRDLNLLSADKQLSYGERRVQEMASQLLVQELAVAQNLPVPEVNAQIARLLGDA